MTKLKSTYRGGKNSRVEVEQILRKKYGDKVADNYDSETDVITMKSINEYGLRVKRGEKAIRVNCICEKKDDNGEVITTFPRKVNLFHVGLQCEKVR